MQGLNHLVGLGLGACIGDRGTRVLGSYLIYFLHVPLLKPLDLMCIVPLLSTSMLVVGFEPEILGSECSVLTSKLRLSP